MSYILFTYNTNYMAPLSILELLICLSPEHFTPYKILSQHWHGTFWTLLHKHLHWTTCTK